MEERVTVTYVGHLLIVLAGTGLGLLAAHRLHSRAAFLGQTDRLLQASEQQIAYTAAPMSDVWRRLATRSGFRNMPLLRDTVAGLEQQPFADALAAAVEDAAQRGLLTDEGRRLLLEFADGCGGYDLAGQQRQIRHYRQCIAALQEQAAQEATLRGRLYRVMGPAAGVALALMLM